MGAARALQQAAGQAATSLGVNADPGRPPMMCAAGGLALLAVIKDLMGHATIDMTKRYAHVSTDTRREAVAVLHRPLTPACDIRATRMEAMFNHP